MRHNSGRVVHTVDEHGGVTASQYDPRGNMIRTLYPDGTETRTAYDALGRAEWVSERYVNCIFSCEPVVGRLPGHEQNRISGLAQVA